MQQNRALKFEDHLSIMNDIINDEHTASQILRSETKGSHVQSQPTLISPDKNIPNSVGTSNAGKGDRIQDSSSESPKAHLPMMSQPEDPVKSPHTGDSNTESSDNSSSQADTQVEVKGEPSPKTEDEVGWKPEVKHLYAEIGNPSVYKDRIPPSSGLSAAATGIEEGYRPFAIIHYHQASRGKLKTDLITIQNEELKKLLASILSEYPSVDTNTPVIEFYLPLIPFLHRWDRLLQAEKTEENSTKKQLLRNLRETIEPELKDAFQASKNLERTGYINFQHILVPFVPGDVLVRTEHGALSAAILERSYVVSRGESKQCTLTVHVVDWNGVKIGYRLKRWTIDEFEGFQKVTDLSVCPLKYRPDQEKIRESLIDRGRVFEKLCGQHVKQYAGQVFVRQKWFYPQPRTIALSERVIIDAEGYYRFQEKPVPELKALDSKRKGKALVNTLLTRDRNSDVSQTQDPLTEDEYMLTRPRVAGFAISGKGWYKFNVTDISPVAWNDNLLQNLVIQNQEKEMLLALVSQTMESGDEGFDDFFKGKGKGLVLLLAGPPGVGKTLTAESVAEELKRPLYRVGAGDLGTAVSRVESSLKSAFDQCAHWNAVLLIDEADVFLERRSSDRMNQNELVSVFLSTLEYYQGVLILTTNRTRDMDSAFESRIDIILTYNHLSQDIRRQIWSKFLERLPSAEIKERDLDDLARWVINGRQIKSAVKTACIIAIKQGKPLGMEHLNVVLDVRKRGSKLIEKHDGQWKKTGFDGKLLGWIEKRWDDMRTRVHL
ncbi:P-loop containing nucleoside triphosphate hydrolase protein [Annulohypoxylon stygium]|nr:P-loop containing nucleoside triphosphate hydrolase protein [Annulohypoxylon stygium]